MAWMAFTISTSKYENARLNLSGRGFRGFTKLSKTDSLANTVVTTLYDADNKSNSVKLLKAETRTLSNKLLSSI